MSLLALLSASSGTGTPIDPDPPPGVEEGVPYVLPLTAPYNVDQVCVTPTPDGSGQTVHPDVKDFGPAGWNGHRYWMGITPFRGGDPTLENPCIFVSDDGFTWETPAGLTNPLDPGTGNSYNANSDTDLEYDPTTGRLYLIWRLYHTGLRTEIIYMSHSTDGTTWSPKVVIFATDGVADGTNTVQQTTSPALVRVGPGDWRIWTANGGSGPDQVRTAADPYGPWSAPTTLNFTGYVNPRTGVVAQPYHLDVIIGPDGRFWMLMEGGAFPAVSTDGVDWTVGGPVITQREGKWDSHLYRATFTPHENGTHMRVWYSCLYDDGVKPEGYYSSQDWWTGYTWVKRDHWTAL